MQKTVAIEIWIESKERQGKHGENTFGEMGVKIWGCGSEEKVERGTKDFSHKEKEISKWNIMYGNGFVKREIHNIE